MVIAAQSGTPPVRTDITGYVRERAAKGAVVHDLSKLPQQLLAAVVNTSLNKLNGLSFCIESNGKQITVSGMDLVKSLQQAGFPPHQIALLLDTMASRRRSPGADNLVHYKFTELKEIAEDANLTNAFYAKAQKAISTKSMASFEQQRDPLAYIPEQATRIDQPNPVAAPNREKPVKVEKAVVYNLAGLLSLATDELSNAPVGAGVKELQLVS